ncbi:MAG: hypothetical protein ACRDKZ_09425 [Actinomycetota bacterium]
MDARRVTRLVTVLAVLLTAAACGRDGRSDSAVRSQSQPEPENAVRVVATEYGYSMPAEIEGGVVSLELLNEGAEHHEFALGHLEDGTTVEQVVRALKRNKGPDGAEDLAGVPLLSPGEQVTMTRELEQGTYFFLCFFPTQDFTSHVDKGMYTSFEVTGDAGAALPQPDATIVATDEGFEVSGLTPGEQVIELRNGGTKPHEFVLMRPNEEGAGTKQFDQWIEGGQKGETPLRFPGGLQTIPPGTSVFQTMTLEEGDYLLEDFTNKLRADISIP